MKPTLHFLTLMFVMMAVRTARRSRRRGHAAPGRARPPLSGVLPKSGVAHFTLAAGLYRAKWFNPRTGEWHELLEVKNSAQAHWTSVKSPDAGDGALRLEELR